MNKFQLIWHYLLYWGNYKELNMDSDMVSKVAKGYFEQGFN